MLCTLASGATAGWPKPLPGNSKTEIRESQRARK